MVAKTVELGISSVILAGLMIWFQVVPSIYILWAPVISRENEIQQGRSVEIGFNDIYKGEDEDELIVYWWRARWEKGELRAGEIRSFKLML